MSSVRRIERRVKSSIEMVVEQRHSVEKVGYVFSGNRKPLGILEGSFI